MRKRYLRSQEMQRTLHGEIVNLFFSEFNNTGNESDDNSAEHKDRSESKRKMFYLVFLLERGRADMDVCFPVV